VTAFLAKLADASQATKDIDAALGAVALGYDGGGTYRLMAHDVVGDRLVVVPKALTAAAAAIYGAVKMDWNDEAALEAAKERVSKLYLRLGRVPPWDAQPDFAAAELMVAELKAASVSPSLPPEPESKENPSPEPFDWLKDLEEPALTTPDGNPVEPDPFLFLNDMLKDEQDG
jgi:hypothetical protein